MPKLRCDWMVNRNLTVAAIALAVAVIFAFAPLASAATYFSINPGKEVCTVVVFGQQGKGEYTLSAQDPDYPDNPWVDNHFTSFVAGPDNIILVPLCFSAIGRSVGDEGNVKVTISAPSGNRTIDYGVCVAEYEDVDVAGASSGACGAMAEHTDIFSASFSQPELYAEPGENALYTLVLDSSLPLTLDIAKGSGDLSVSASQSSVSVGDGQQQVQLSVAAPAGGGDYDFSVIVSAQGCSIADCVRDVKGKLHVKDVEEQPQAGFYAWLTPETKSIIGQQSTMYVLKFTNYGDGQEFTASVSLEEGLETGFSPYSVFLAKGESKSVQFTVRPATSERKTYKLTAVVQGKDGSKRSAEAWLTVDEMVADADKLGDEDFITDYNVQGGASLEDWEELRSVTGAAAGGVTAPATGTTAGPEGPNYMLWAVIIIVVAVICILAFYIYRKTKVEGGEEKGWKDLGM